MKLDKNSRTTAADPSEQAKADAKKRAWLAKKPTIGYAHTAGVKRFKAGTSNHYLDRPGHLQGADESRLGNKGGSTGHDGAGSN